MTSSADVIDLDAWRDPDGVLRRAQSGNPMPFGWGSLTMPSDCRDFAKWYRRLDLHPILLYGIKEDGSCMCWQGAKCPPKTRGKHPVGTDWETLPPDVEAIDRALRKNWRFNIGLRMGLQPSGVTLVAIDVDGDLSLLEPFEREHGSKFPPTLTAKTARGYHLIYRVPADMKIPNAVKLAPGIDVRSQGGQIVAPPSRHVSGVRYTWLSAREPEVLT